MDSFVHCPICGTPISHDQAADIKEDTDFESKSCPVCCRAYAAARLEFLVPF